MLRHKHRTDDERDLAVYTDGEDHDQRVMDDEEHDLRREDDRADLRDRDRLRRAERGDEALPPPFRRAEEVTTERTFSVGQFLILLCGAGALALGIVTLARGKLDGSITEPTVDVLGFTHTPLLGVFEIGAGILLILAGLRPGGRVLAGLVGAALIVAGALVLAELTWAQEKLATEQEFGWFPIGIGAITLIAAYAFPAKTRRVTEIR